MGMGGCVIFDLRVGARAARFGYFVDFENSNSAQYNLTLTF